MLIVIMAGGGGERLWPKSRKNFPKQCISLNGAQSLIQNTYRIAVEMVGKENIFISTRREIAPLIQDQLPHARLITEPLGRDSAAGLGYVCALLLHENIDDVVVFMGSDYHIPNTLRFNEVLRVAALFAEENKISTIGIKPSRIETGFGYINPGKILKQDSIQVYEVEGFTEKPNQKLAHDYIADGYLWNSGMFVVKPSILYQNIRQYMPDLHHALEKIREIGFNAKDTFQIFESLPKISIDYGVMEKTEDLVVVQGDFVWDDIGTWDSLDRIMEQDNNKNIVQGKFLGVDVERSIVFSKKPLIAFGVSDLVIIETEDCIFVCEKNKSKQIKKLISELEKDPNYHKLLNFEL